ncbi:CAP domain-containing protein [Mycena vitilis]|nr:CAP domain-containing protein [Mycena vitilis]
MFATSFVSLRCFAVLALFALDASVAAAVRKSLGNGSRASNADVQVYLQTHNTIRSQHNAVPVTWSNDAAQKAQQWADECKNVHSGGALGPLGENLAAGTGEFTIETAVKAWTDEVCTLISRSTPASSKPQTAKYDTNNPHPSHFTQVVWKATTEIGCAVQTCNGIFAGFGAAQYYVCEYSVQGNVIGHFGANVEVDSGHQASPTQGKSAPHSSNTHANPALQASTGPPLTTVEVTSTSTVHAITTVDVTSTVIIKAAPKVQDTHPTPQASSKCQTNQRRRL